MDRRPGQRPDRRGPGRGRAHPVQGHRCGHARKLRLPRRLRRRPREHHRRGGHPPRRRPHRRRPARRRVRRVLGADRRALRPRPHGRQPRGRPDVALHDARLGREDPHGSVVALGDGRARRPPRRVRRAHRQRRGCRQARHRDARRRPDEPEPLPRRRDRLSVRAPPAVAGRRRRRQDARVVDDHRPGRRVARSAPARGARGLQVVRPGPAGRLGGVRWRRVGGGVLPPCRRHRLDDRQGRHPAVPARRRDHRGHRQEPVAALRGAGGRVRCVRLPARGRPGIPRTEGGAVQARSGGRHRDGARRRADHREAVPRAGQRRRDRRPEGADRARLVRRAPVRHRGRLQALRRVVAR